MFFMQKKSSTYVLEIINIEYRISICISDYIHPKMSSFFTHLNVINRLEIQH